MCLHLDHVFLLKELLLDSLALGLFITAVANCHSLFDIHLVWMDRSMEHVLRLMFLRRRKPRMTLQPVNSRLHLLQSDQLVWMNGAIARIFRQAMRRRRSTALQPVNTVLHLFQ